MRSLARCLLLASVLSYRTTPGTRAPLRVEWPRGFLPVPAQLHEQAR